MAEVKIPRHVQSDIQYHVTHDQYGNTKPIQIRGKRTVMGDGASSIVDNTVAIGTGVSNTQANTAIIGANSVNMIKITTSGAFPMGVENNVTTGATLTAAQIAPQAVVDISSGGAGNLTLPTGTALDTAYTDLSVGSAWSFFINNNGGGAVTLVGNTGTTLDGDTPTSTAIANGDGVQVHLRRTAANTYVVRVIGRVAGGGGGSGVIIAGAGANSFMYTGAAGAAGSASQAMGLTASSAGDNSIAIGRDATSSADSAISIGYASDATVANAIAIGGDSAGTNGAQATSTGAIAIGRTSVASNTQGIAIGVSSTASGVNSLCLGQISTATGQGTITIGTSATGSADNAICIGRVADATFNAAVAIGCGAQATAVEAIAIGGDSGELTPGAANATGIASIAIGTNSLSSGIDSIALGSSAEATSQGAISIGQGVTNATGNTINLGTNAIVYSKIHSSALVQDAGYAVGNASYVSTADTAPTLNSALPFYPGTILVGAPTVGRAYTLDTGTNYDTQFPHFANNDSFTFSIVNNGSATITLTAAAGSTISGTATVAADFTRVFQLQKTGVATWVATSLDVLSHLAAAGGTAVIVAGAGTNSMQYTTATASGDRGIAIGDAATATGPNCISLGRQADSTNVTGASIAIGYLAQADGEESIAIGGDSGGVAGNAAQALGNYSIAIGEKCNTAALQSYCFAIGNNVSISGSHAISIGQSTAVSATNYGIGLGSAHTVSGTSGIAIGNHSDATASDTIAIGGDSAGATGAQATATRVIAIGKGANGSAADGISIGATDTNNSQFGIGIGKGALVSSATAGVAIGCRAVSGGTQAIAIGGDTTDAVPPAYLGAQAAGNQSIAIGAGCDALNASCIGIGYQAVASANYNMAIGDNASATTSNYQISIGKNCSSSAGAGIAIGNRSTATASEAIAIGGDASDVAGAGADATGTGSIAIGENSTSSATHSISIGGSSQATANYALAIGQNITNAIANSVHLGGGGVSCMKADGAAVYSSANNEGNGFIGYPNATADIGTGNKTLTLAQVSPNAFLWTSATDNMGASANWTTPSGADLTNRYSWIISGMGFDFEIYNVNSSLMGGQIIMVAGTNIVLSGTTTVNTTNCRKYRCIKTSGSTNEWTIYGLYEWTPVSR